LPPLPEQQRIVARVEALEVKIKEALGLRRAAAEERRALESTSQRAIIETLSDKNQVALGDVVSIRGGGTPSKSNPTYWQGAIPWVTPKDMKTRDIYDAIDHISENAIKESSAKLLDSESVLIVTRGMILAHTVPVAVLRVPAAINQDMKCLVPETGLLPDYLSWALWAYNKRMFQNLTNTRRGRPPIGFSGLPTGDL
jgi:type I restriction enzyme S subunit